MTRQQPEDILLPLLREVVPDGEGRWKACCPIHAGGQEQHQSLGISRAADGKLLLHCFVCGPEVRAAQFCLAVGLTQAALYPDDAHRRGGHKPGSAWRGRIVATYDYLDADGALRYQVCRLDPKDFRQRRPNGKGGWIRNLRGVERVLYRLPQLIAADKSQPVLIVEGEKDVDRLASLGLVATTNVGGAGKWLRKYNAALAGRDVVILPDNDAPGNEHAAKIVLSLAGTAKSVKTVSLPGLPPKGDVSDWLDAGGTAAQLLDLCRAQAETPLPAPSPQQPAPPAVDDPAATHFELELLRLLGLDVLGEIEGSGGAAKVFSESHRKSDVIRDVAKLSYERLEMICGPAVKALICRGSEPPPGMYTLPDVRQAIGLLAGYRRIGDDTEVGVGCWQGLTDRGDPADSIVLVGAGEAAKWNGTQTLERIRKPRADGRLLDIGSSEPWYDVDELARLLPACDQSIAESALRDAVDLFSRWTWRHEESPLVVAGLVLATWVQTIWAWRPQVAIIGRSNSGKSTLFESLEGIFGALAMKSSKSSAAGIRQSIRRSAKVVLCDEFESGRHRDDILEMLRASGRGDRVLRGTTGHRGQEFALRHIAWIAAIESGLKREPDRNRFVTLELVPPAAELMGRLICPPAGELGQLGQRLLAVAVRYGLAARGLAVDLKSRRFSGVHPRQVESYAVPAAIVATLLGLSGDDAADVLARMLRTVDVEEGGQSDDEALLADILASNVDFGHGERGTVGQAISCRRTIAGSDPALNQVGLCVFEDEPMDTPAGRQVGDWLFVGCDTVARKLLRDTPWATQSIDQILTRIPGAVRTRKRFGGAQYRGVALPLAVIEPPELGF